MATVDRQLGAIARPARVAWGGLPKTRSGKLLRRAIAALAKDASRAICPRSRIRWLCNRRARRR